MKKDAYYFSHDSNARDDEKLVNLRIEHDWYGYGLYWAIIELLRNANAYKMQCNFKALAYTLHCDEKTIESIINDFDLFIVEDNYFCSESLNRRMELKESKSEKARNSANKRWSNNANALQSHCERYASKGKEKKEKESKVNKNKNKNKYKFPISKALNNTPEDYKELFFSWLGVYFEVHGKMTEAAQEAQLRRLFDIPKSKRIRCLNDAIAGQWKNIQDIKIDDNNGIKSEQEKLLEHIDGMPSQFDDNFEENLNQNMPEIAI